jgi:hypothetical protein
VWAIDFPTLVLILAAGFELGSLGVFGCSLFGWAFGSWKLPHEYRKLGENVGHSGLPSKVQPSGSGCSSSQPGYHQK